MAGALTEKAGLRNSSPEPERGHTKCVMEGLGREVGASPWEVLNTVMTTQELILEVKRGQIWGSKKL